MVSKSHIRAAVLACLDVGNWIILQKNLQIGREALSKRFQFTTSFSNFIENTSQECNILSQVDQLFINVSVDRAHDTGLIILTEQKAVA